MFLKVFSSNTGNIYI